MLGGTLEGLDGEAALLDEQLGALGDGVGEVSGLDGGCLDDGEVFPWDEGVVAHSIEDVVEGGEVEGAESEKHMGATCLEDELGKPLMEENIAVVDDVCLVEAFEFFQGSLELGELAAGFEDVHGVLFCFSSVKLDAEVVLFVG